MATIALTIAFALSVQLGERGVQFDLSHASVEAGETEDDDYTLSSLRIFNRALLQIKEKYVEPDRVGPGEMLLASLDAVQNEIPEFVVDYERGDDDEAIPSRVEIQVVDERQTFELHAMESLWEMSLRLKEIFLFVEQHLPDDPERDARDIEYAAINGMVTTLDPHSGLLTPTHYKEMQTQTGGEFGGLGIVISIQDNQLTVISPIDGTPAAKQGIRSQDKIVRIGEESTVNMNLNEAVSRLRGEPGTEVDVWVERDGWSEPRQFTIERAIIEIESVESEPLADKIGYLRINNFQANTYGDMRQHLKDLRTNMGGIHGLVLDMRDNPGGLLDQSIQISDAFLSEGTIVSTVGHGDTLRDTQEAKSANTEEDYPIVVLLNEGSASASEIVAGALQQNDRAVVVGDVSFGKGTVQILYEFPDDSALKLTVAQYLTPDGVSIQNTGIIPDLQAIPVNVQERDVTLFRSELMQRERDIDRALENPTTRPDDDGPLSLIRYLDADAFDRQAEPDDPNEFEMDFEISLASRLLGAVNDNNRRSEMLDASQSELESVFETQMDEIQDELRQLGVDWTAGESPREPAYELSVESSSGQSPAPAGETVEITASLTNRGAEPLYRAKALTRSDNPILRHREFIFGRVEPDETREWTIEVDIPQDSKTRHDRINLSLSDDDQEYAGEHHYDLVIEGKERPRYAFTYEISPDELSDGLLRTGDDVTLRIHLENTGDVVGDDTSLYLKNLTGGEVYLEKGRAVVTDLEPGASEYVDLRFELTDIPEDGLVTLELDVYDSGYREFFQREFTIPVADEASSIEEWQGLATVGDRSASLYVSGDDRSDPAATASSGATLPVIARTDDWLKVDLDERHAWIRAADVSAEEGASGELAGVDRIMRFQKPVVALRPADLFTTGHSIDLEGSIDDEWDIQDYYIIVYHQDGPMEVETRKLAYHSVGARQAQVSTDVPLFEGMNQISVVTRNDAGISTTETIYVYRE